MERKSFRLRLAPALSAAFEPPAQQPLHSVNGPIEFRRRDEVQRREKLRVHEPHLPSKAVSGLEQPLAPTAPG